MQEQDWGWLCDEVLDGLTRLLSLRLPDAPPAEIVELTATVWQDALINMNKAWDEALDAERIKKGFIRLSQECVKWPVPKILLEHMPPRKLPPLLPPPPPSPDEAREILAFLKKQKMEVRIKEVNRLKEEEETRREWEDRKQKEIQAKQAALAHYARLQGIKYGHEVEEA